MSEILHGALIETPLGMMQAMATSRGLCALEFIKSDRQRLLESRLARWFPAARIEMAGSPYLSQARAWLERFFASDFARLPTIALDARGTDFERSVWRHMQSIQPGATLSYGELAARIGSPRAFRAVGNASRRNSIALIIPCHRVVGSAGGLTGYGGGLNHKKWLIDHELQAKALRTVSRVFSKPVRATSSGS